MDATHRNYLIGNQLCIIFSKNHYGFYDTTLIFSGVSTKGTDPCTPGPDKEDPTSMFADICREDVVDWLIRFGNEEVRECLTS